MVNASSRSLLVLSQVESENVPAQLHGGSQQQSRAPARDGHQDPSSSPSSPPRPAEGRGHLRLSLVLADPMGPGGGLQVILWIEVAVHKDNGVCGCEVHADSTCKPHTGQCDQPHVSCSPGKTRAAVVRLTTQGL